MSQPAGLEIVEALEAHDFDMGCDYDDDDWHKAITHEHGPARWIARARCEDCGLGETRLLCSPCKNLIVQTEHGLRCARCETVIVPARRAFTSFEPLEKK
jgi:hypothetical protein